MTTYNPNIPQATDDPSTSQAQLLDNFGELNTFLAVNHVALNASGQGKHTFAELVNQAAIPPGLVANEGTLYTKQVSSVSQLFYTPDNSGIEYQMTGNFTSADIGSLLIPGGLIMNWGSGTIAGGSTPVTYHTAFTTATYVITLGNGANTPSTVFMTYNSPMLAGFTLLSNAGAGAAYSYIAIGK